MNYHQILHCSENGDSFDGPTELKMDLRYLAPLWKLYKTLSADHGPEQTSAVLRALTELFFIAENIAMVSEHMSYATVLCYLVASSLVGIMFLVVFLRYPFYK